MTHRNYDRGCIGVIISIGSLQRNVGTPDSVVVEALQAGRSRVRDPMK
jgi:hypothetical protein